MFPGSKDEKAIFQQSILEYLDGMYGMAMRLTKNKANAEDLVQDTYVRAVRFYQKFEPGTNLRAWLFKMIVNLFLNQC